MIYRYDKNTGAAILKIQSSWGVEYQKTNAMLHREDGPAVERNNGTNEWYINGKRHREDGPAIECANGSKLWYRHGNLHRNDGPAIIKADGTEEWHWLGEKIIKEDEEYKKSLNSSNLPTDKADISKTITSIRDHQKAKYSLKIK